ARITTEVRMASVTRNASASRTRMLAITVGRPGKDACRKLSATRRDVEGGGPDAIFHRRETFNIQGGQRVPKGWASTGSAVASGPEPYATDEHHSGAQCRTEPRSLQSGA